MVHELQNSEWQSFTSASILVHTFRHFMQNVEFYFLSIATNIDIQKLFAEMNRFNLCKCESSLHVYSTQHHGCKIVIPSLNLIPNYFHKHWQTQTHTEQSKREIRWHFYHKMKNGNENHWSRSPHINPCSFKPLKYSRGVECNFYKIPDHLRSTWKINFQGWACPFFYSLHFLAATAAATTTSMPLKCMCAFFCCCISSFLFVWKIFSQN